MAAMTVRLISWSGEREGAHRDQRVVEAGHHCGHAVNQLKAKPEVDQHARHGVERGQAGLLLKLLAHRGAHHLHIAHGEGIVVVRLQRIDDLLAARVERGLVGLLGQADQHLVVAGHIVVHARSHP